MDSTNPNHSNKYKHIRNIEKEFEQYGFAIEFSAAKRSYGVSNFTQTHICTAEDFVSAMPSYLLELVKQKQKHTTKKENKMKKLNPSYLLTLVCEQIKTIEVTFNPDEPNAQKYTYLTILPNLKVLDDVIVEAGNDLKVAQVVVIHDDAEVDPDAQYSYKWAVSTSGSKARESQKYLHEMETEALKQIKAAKKRAAKKKLQAEIGDLFGTELDAIKKIQFNPELD